VHHLSACEVDGTLEDIKRNGFNFTDGCGNISKELADTIA
jgi:hypothetical protein